MEGSEIVRLIGRRLRLERRGKRNRLKTDPIQPGLQHPKCSADQASAQHRDIHLLQSYLRDLECEKDR